MWMLAPFVTVGSMIQPRRTRPAASRPPQRFGLSGVELIVILGVAAFFGLLVLIALPKGRESARLTTCQRNLMQLGLGVQLYVQASRHLPTVPPLGQPGVSPIQALLDGLALPDFLSVRDPTTPPAPGQPPAPGTRVAGLVCPSDPQVGPGASISALSYRANAGDRPEGSTGPFAPGILVTPARIEAANGLSYTAGFAERLLGTGRDGEPGPTNYQRSPGPIRAPCPALRSDLSFWRGDAGASWAESGWRSALYLHTSLPNSSPSCLADDDQTANITASSNHPDRINVSLLDGSLRTIKPTIDPTVWQRLGSIAVSPSPEAGSVP